MSSQHLFPLVLQTVCASEFQVLRYMALRNGYNANNLILQRVGATKPGSRSNRQTGVLQLAIHPVLRLRTMVLMYIW